MNKAGIEEYTAVYRKNNKKVSNYSIYELAKFKILKS